MSGEQDFLRKPARFKIQEVIDSLERYGQYDFRSEGYIKIERRSLNHALDAYKQTLMSIPGKMEGETPSSTMVSSAQVEWSAEPAEIGFRVRQRHIGITHPEVRDQINNWADSGKPYPSGGGFYHTTPNKSYQRVKELSGFPELRDAILRLHAEEDWFHFWDRYLPLRYEVSNQLLHMVQTGTDPEALSRHNEEAGTGLYIRGRRLYRKDLASVGSDLDFLLKYAYSMGVAFAAVQIAKLDSKFVWMVNVYDPRIKGAIASRSDLDIKDVEWDGERLIIDGLAQTRQAGSDCSGTLSNSHTERKLMRSSVTESVLRDLKGEGVEYPFTDRNLLIKIWGLDAKPFKGKEYVIGNDLGLMEPVKSPADALFSRGFLSISSKVMPMMLSGSGWTQAVYSVFHNFFMRRAATGDKLLALGDDCNLVTARSKETLFDPYVKVKSTDADKNTKKILGLYSVMSVKDDPNGDEQALVGIVPRVIKSLSSATKRGSQWGESLSNLPMKGKLDIAQPEETMLRIRADLEILKPYMQWKGPRRELNAGLQATWTTIRPETWKVLVHHNEEIEHRFPRDEG